jgi:hypothetical protein
MRTRRRTTVTVILIALMVLWLLSPIGWLLAAGQVYPDSGTQANLQQRQNMAWVNLVELTIGVGAPVLVMLVAWLTRRVTLAAVAAIALIVSNLLLIFVEAPIWTLFAASIRTISEG